LTNLNVDAQLDAFDQNPFRINHVFAELVCQAKCALVRGNEAILAPAGRFSLGWFVDRTCFSLNRGGGARLPHFYGMLFSVAPFFNYCVMSLTKKPDANRELAAWH
jgi:hypothetical protein